MYRNVVFDSRHGEIVLFTWNENGERIETREPFKPYLLIESPKGTKTSIFGTKLEKKAFKNYFLRSQYIQDSGIRRIFENFTPTQQFLIDKYWDQKENENFNKFPLKIIYIDIETNTMGQGFPNIEDPDQEINVVTCYDSLKQKYFTFGLGEFITNEPDIIYKNCKSEKELLESLIKFLRDDPCDLLSGYASETFDIPYLINRCNKILGEEATKKLSPVSFIRKSYYASKFGKQQMRYYIEGISCIDYLEIYKKFCFTERPSYKLDYIANIEIGEQKVDFGDMSLAQLAESNWNKFVEYNIHDVRLLVKLEEKLQYISLLRMLAYTGLCPFENALGTITVVNGAMACQARQRGEHVPTFVKDKESFTGTYFCRLTL